jgi:hypothetical protein
MEDTPENRDDHLNYLQGRIIALELLVRGMLSNMIATSQRVPEFRTGTLASLQMVERPIDEESDAIWGHASAALMEMFEQVEHRLRYEEDRSRTSRP